MPIEDVQEVIAYFLFHSFLFLLLLLLFVLRWLLSLLLLLHIPLVKLLDHMTKLADDRDFPLTWSHPIAT